MTTRTHAHVVCGGRVVKHERPENLPWRRGFRDASYRVQLCTSLCTSLCSLVRSEEGPIAFRGGCRCRCRHPRTPCVPSSCITGSASRPYATWCSFPELGCAERARSARPGHGRQDRSDHGDLPEMDQDQTLTSSPSCSCEHVTATSRLVTAFCPIAEARSRARGCIGVAASG